jgi:multicomponent Na+:H+ antiporter subunit F
MSILALAVALFLLANLVIALVAAARGPTPADRMLMALLFGTTGTAVLVLLAAAGANTSLVDMALVLALLAAIGGIAFATRAWRDEPDDADDDAG